MTTLRITLLVICVGDPIVIMSKIQYEMVIILDQVGYGARITTNSQKKTPVLYAAESVSVVYVLVNETE